MIRYLKIVLVVLVGLQGLFYFISNAVNFEYAQGAVGAVLSQADSPAYPNLIIPAIESPALVMLALLVIMAGELLVGFFQVFGAALLQMWQSQVGIGSFEGAFMYHGASALVLLFLNQKDE